jgi:hypothetical protein
MPNDMLPVLRLNEPPLVILWVFSTQSGGVEMGTGTPKLQPVKEQSGSLLLTAGGVDVGLTKQLS